MSYRHLDPLDDRVYVCADCGVLVADIPVHDRFHATLDEQGGMLAVLRTSHLSPRAHEERYGTEPREQRYNAAFNRIEDMPLPRPSE